MTCMAREAEGHWRLHPSVPLFIKHLSQWMLRVRGHGHGCSCMILGPTRCQANGPGQGADICIAGVAIPALGLGGQVYEPPERIRDVTK